MLNLRKTPGFYLTAVALLLLCISSVPAQQSDEVVPFETVVKQFSSGHTEKANYIITTKREWKKLWKVIHAKFSVKPPLPEVDFTQYMIIGVFQGQVASSGYAISITRVVKTEGKLKVFIEERTPGFECALLPVITEPYHVIQTERVEKSLRKNAEYEVEQKVIECPRLD